MAAIPPFDVLAVVGSTGFDNIDIASALYPAKSRTFR